VYRGARILVVKPSSLRRTYAGRSGIPELHPAKEMHSGPANGSINISEFPDTVIPDTA
jgi:hypothetical protein